MKIFNAALQNICNKMQIAFNFWHSVFQNRETNRPCQFQMSVIILGSSGNLGQVIVNYLSSKTSDQIFCLDNKKPKYNLEKTNLNFCECNFIVEGFPPQLINELLKNNTALTFINLIAKDYPVLQNLDKSNLNDSPFELSLAEVCESYKTTLGSSYKLIQEIHKLKLSSYHVIFVGSIYGISLPKHSIYNDPQQTKLIKYKPVAYSLAKSAQIMLLKEAVRTFGTKDKRFNMISFGGIKLDQDEDFQSRYKKTTPNNEMVSLPEVCDSFNFMINHAPTSMNGTDLVVDGGWTCAN